ncbi:MAG: hypothetical protein N3G20_12315 [Verrucomicrobiae bacterium]|nr:hypothetical protein [Verrucomicrobiae bacterium]
MPAAYKAGTPLNVAIEVVPAPSVAVHAIEHQIPPGWTASNISTGGFYDPSTRKVKWGPFFDARERTVTYDVTPPPGCTNTVTFAGAAAFDGNVAALSGASVVQPAAAVQADPFARRCLPTFYIDGAKLVVKIETGEITGHTFYSLWDSPPPGWTVGQISDGGFYDASTRSVRFGPFYDGTPRVLWYEISPPIGENGPKQFLGMFEIDFVPGVTGGDIKIESFTRHPADRSPIDGWIGISEAIAYAAAWKRGAAWPTGPVPIQLELVTKAIELWLAGEGYTPATNGLGELTWLPRLPGDAPLYPMPEFPPPPTQQTNGAASAAVQGEIVPNSIVLVSISVTPGTNVAVYAVEDQPPPNWLVTEVGTGGTVDVIQGKVKWGPFFDSKPRALIYRVQVPANVEIVSRFAGVVAFDSAIASITGNRKVFRCDVDLAPRFVQIRTLTNAVELILKGIPGEWYRIESSTDLRAWSALGWLTTTNSIGISVLTNDSGLRFYRAVWP